MESNLALTVSFIIYSAGIVAFGLDSTKLRKKTADDFVLANRELGPWAASLSSAASAESGWVMLGLVGEAYLYGAAAGMLTGAIVTIIWRNVEALKAIVYELVPAFILAFLAVIIFSLITSKDKPENG
ncbi:MAG: hypothetical protein AB1483_06355 [Candidatus Zixiibacteriota bacterium]